MALSFEALTEALTETEAQALLLNGLKGVGPIFPEGATGGAAVGTGSVSYVSGTPSADADVQIRIVGTGEPGVASFGYSLNGGSTWSATTTMPSSGASYTLGTSGIVIKFEAGPTGYGTSFISGDLYKLSLLKQAFPVTSWQAGSVPRTLVAIDAQAIASLSSLQALLAQGALLSTATGPWLTLRALETYGLPRNDSVATKGTIVLTDTGNSGPYTISAGGMTVASANGLRFTNTSSLTLPHGGSVSGTWEAETTGAAYNVGNGSITSIVAGNLPGVTVNNPDPGTGTWITTQGVDEEADEALRSRARARWPSLGATPAATSAVFDLWARTASAQVTRTAIAASVTVPGEVDVYLAGPSGGVSGGVVTTVQAYIDARTGLTNSANVVAASNVPVTVTATVTYESALTTLSAVQSAITTNLTAFFEQQPMGKDGAGSVKVYLDEIREQITAVPGVRSASPITSPVGDTALTTGQVATLTLSFGSWTFIAL